MHLTVLSFQIYYQDVDYIQIKQVLLVTGVVACELLKYPILEALTPILQEDYDLIVQIQSCQ